MKKFLTLSLLSVLLLSSCSTIEENELMNPVTEENELIAPSSKYLTPEEAAEKAKTFMNITSSKKRESRGNKEFEVKSARLIDFGKKSRSVDIPDSMFYAVDFEDGGYSIVAAERDLLNNIYFYTDEGEFSLEGSPVLELYLSESAKTMDQAPRKSNMELTDARSRAKVIPDPENPDIITGEEWINGVLCVYYYKSSESHVDPITTTKWDYDLPYNYYCPIIKGVRSYAGCSAVAIGQIAATHRYPEFFNGNNYNWDYMLSNPVHTSSYDIGAKEIAQFLYDIGSDIGLDYEEIIPSANIYQVLKGFKDLGYSNAIIKEFSSALCTLSISKGNAVYVQGFTKKMVKDEETSQEKEKKEGHAWVADGFNSINNWIEYYRKDTGELYASYGGVNYTYLHFNIGWGGDDDGFYLCLTQGEGIQNYEFNLNNQIITDIYI